MTSPSRAVGLGLAALGIVLVVAAVAPSALWQASMRSAPAAGPGSGTRYAPAAEAAVPVAPPASDLSSRPVDLDPPSTVLIPTIGVAVELDPLGIRPDGTLAVPDDFARAGWYAEGPEPGESGAAVVVGHVDSRHGPAAFFRLHELRPGQPIMIQTTSGATRRFEVERVEQHAKQRFPTTAVYTPTPEPSLRLITCGGEFDRNETTYRDNVIVFARSAG